MCVGLPPLICMFVISCKEQFQSFTPDAYYARNVFNLVNVYLQKITWKYYFIISQFFIYLNIQRAVGLVCLWVTLTSRVPWSMDAGTSEESEGGDRGPTCSKEDAAKGHRFTRLWNCFFFFKYFNWEISWDWNSIWYLRLWRLGTWLFLKIGRD